MPDINKRTKKLKEIAHRIKTYVKVKTSQVTTPSGKIVTFYECISCHNDWLLNEGFRLDTGQCAGCQKWDDEKEKREKEYQERLNLPKVDFPYVPGDPFW